MLRRETRNLQPDTQRRLGIGITIMQHSKIEPCFDVAKFNVMIAGRFQHCDGFTKLPLIGMHRQCAIGGVIGAAQITALQAHCRFLCVAVCRRKWC